MSNLLETLSRELGTDARSEALRRHPELESMPAEHVNELVQAIEYVLECQSWPATLENCERAYRVLKTFSAPAAPAPTPEAFTPRADEDEFLRTAPLSEVRDYLLAKHQTEAP